MCLEIINLLSEQAVDNETRMLTADGLYYNLLI